MTFERRIAVYLRSLLRSIWNHCHHSSSFPTHSSCQAASGQPKHKRKSTSPSSDLLPERAHHISSHPFLHPHHSSRESQFPLPGKSPHHRRPPLPIPPYPRPHPLHRLRHPIPPQRTARQHPCIPQRRPARLRLKHPPHQPFLDPHRLHAIFPVLLVRQHEQRDGFRGGVLEDGFEGELAFGETAGGGVVGVCIF